MKKYNKLIAFIVGSFILLSCSNNNKTSLKTDISEDSIKSLILAKENAAMQSIR